MSTETHDILAGTIRELEEREQALAEEIERVQAVAKQELRDVRKALSALRKQLGAPSANGSDAPPAGPLDPETKDAVLRELEARSQSGAGGARPASIATAQSLDPNATKRALAELRESGDVESYGKGLWRLAE